jgi:hypothetical protein
MAHGDARDPILGLGLPHINSCRRGVTKLFDRLRRRELNKRADYLSCFGGHGRGRTTPRCTSMQWAPIRLIIAPPLGDVHPVRRFL